MYMYIAGEPYVSKRELQKDPWERKTTKNDTEEIAME